MSGRRIEVFIAGCPLCQEAVEVVKRLACPSCDVSVLDMTDPEVVARARDLGIQRVPAVVVDGELADCCQGRSVDPEVLAQLGVGTSG